MIPAMAEMEGGHDPASPLGFGALEMVLMGVGVLITVLVLVVLVLAIRFLLARTKQVHAETGAATQQR